VDDDAGLMERLPDGSTVPMPLSIVTLVAFDEFQERVVDCPFSMAAGETAREIVGAGADGWDGVCVVAVLVTTGGWGGTFLPLHPAAEISEASNVIERAACRYREVFIAVTPSRFCESNF
jgi:hypothetical protein